MSEQTQLCTPAQAPISYRSRPEPPSLLSVREILTRPMPHLSDLRLTRWLIRGVLLLFRHRFIELRGFHHLQIENDPFVLALNHSQKIESIFLPSLFSYYRQGKMVHFFADWNFLLVPGVAMLFRHGQTIIVDRKPAKPRFLNVFKPMLTEKEPGFVRARRKLEGGAPVGVFAEGTTNRDPDRLLPGYLGAAQLSLDARVPVIPAGVRFPRNPAGRPISEFAAMVVEVGEPMMPPSDLGRRRRETVLEWHGAIMEEIARLSGKAWQPRTRRTTHVA